MTHQVLARKWRPQRFIDVVGQEHILTALANGLTMGRIHHAYLFSGTRGVGKTSIARLLAKSLNCETGITAVPCGQCDSCREIEQGRFVDLIEIDAASRTKVEDTRELLDNVQYAPVRGRFKIYLIDEVHMLSRHSFNALLKTLEEPPDHVKFLLATTDPQKLPITILSRCLQFHLQALDVELIRRQLEKILQAEGIESETRGLQLLARAAQGSMRDALSLSDQAIAMGQGLVSTALVSQMLGLLDEQQPLALLEALVAGDGKELMEQVEHAAARGADWETVLVEMLALLHRVAMAQLLPTLANQDGQTNESRLHELARTLPPQDIQLYYQILLLGRKELAYAPDRRMGVEMALLRALAFHPKVIAHEQQAAPDLKSTPQNLPNTATAPATPAVQKASVTIDSAKGLPESTAQLLQARQQIKNRQEKLPTKKDEPTVLLAQSERLALKKPSQVAEQKHTANKSKPPEKKPAYRWQAQHKLVESSSVETVATPKLLRTALEDEKTPELMIKLAQEAKSRDAWAAEVDQLQVPRLVQQLALNAFKEELAPELICLHLRTSQRHLNSATAQRILAEALSQLSGRAIALNIIEDDNPNIRTPLEWRQVIYEEKLAQARQSMFSDPHIQTVCQWFDAHLDEESIRPV